MKKTLIWGGVGVAAIIVVGALAFGGNKGNTMEYETTTMSGTTVRTLVSVVGSVKAEKETRLSFARNGTVTTVSAKEGDRVSSGQILAELKKDDLALEVDRATAALNVERSTLSKLQSGLSTNERAVLDTNIANAHTAIDALKKSVQATHDRTQKEVQEAQLAYDNAKQVYESSKSSSINTNDADISALQSAVASANASLAATLSANTQSIQAAQTNLDNAKKDLEANTPISNKNLADAEERSFYDASKYMDEADKSLRAINDIITVEDYNKDANGPYRNLLGAKLQNSYNDTVNGYATLRNSYNANSTLFQITGAPLSYDEILKRLDTLRSLLDASYTELTTTYTMLENSQTSIDLPQTKLEAFRTSILTQRASVSSSISAVATIHQNVENLELQKTSSITTYQNRVDAAQASLTSANAQASAAETQARNAVTAAQDNLKKATAGLSSKDIDLQRLANAADEAATRLASAQARLNEQVATSNKSISDLQSQLASAEAQRTSQASPARPEDIAIQKSRVSQAETSLKVAETNMQDAYIRAPKDGIIAKVSIKEGEQTTPAAEAISLISDDFSVIEANIAENEIAQVRPGETVDLTFDAFSADDKYTGQVTFIDPAQTALDGVIYYRTEITFNPAQFPANTVRPGFSANLDIVTQEKTAQAVPVQAVKDAGDKGKKVDVLVGEGKDAHTEERFVQTGLVGDEYTEILSGLTEADRVVLSVTDPSKK